ncbi:MAG: ion channel, partial [Geminicoccales bacterium]
MRAIDFALTARGYGDITLNESWRILSALCAANGLLLFGFSTAFLVELMRRLQQEPKEADENHAS